MAEDLGEKTEDPTPKRREQAREEGNIARSQDLAGAVLLTGATLLLCVAMMPILGHFRVVVEETLDGATLGSPTDPGEVMTVLAYAGQAVVRIGAPVLLGTWLIALMAHLIQVGWLFSPKAAMPKLNKVNPITGFQRLFSLTSLVKAGMDSLKVTIVLTVAVLTIYQRRDEIIVMPYLSAMQALGRAGWLMLDLALRILAVLLLLGILDLMYQRWKHTQDLRMTRQQVKDEMKQTEGDPEVKKRRMRMQQQVAMQRISAAVPKADVIVTNPEHISVAISYDADRMSAPRVLAKGADFLALRIRQIALTHSIPIVERPPLARALYRQVEVGQEIPPDLYKAVAEVLAYVYRLNDTRRAG